MSIAGHKVNDNNKRQVVKIKSFGIYPNCPNNMCIIRSIRPIGYWTNNESR